MADLGSGMSAAASIFQGIAGYRAGQYNAASDRNAAINAERLGVAQQSRVRDAVRAQVGEQIAGQFSNGMEGGAGSAISAVHESLVQGALDALTIRQQAMARADTLNAEGSMAMEEGKNALISGLLGAGAKTYGGMQDWAVAQRGIVSPGQSASAGGSGGGYYNPNQMSGDGLSWASAS